MDYLCGYYWNQEDGESSLVLKQLTFPGGAPVVFACWAEGERHRHWMKGVISWFQEKVLPRCQKCREDMKGLEAELCKFLDVMPCQPQGAGMVLCIGECFLVWGMGGQRLWLLNTRFGKPHFRCLLHEETEGDSNVLSGILEPGVGLLSANMSLFAGVSKEQILDCLAVKKLDGELRLQKRLQELGEEAAGKGKEHPAAVLVVTR